MINIYKNVNLRQFCHGRGNYLHDLAKGFGAENLSELNQWLACIRIIRNKCAHHSRLWNTNLQQPRSISQYISEGGNGNRVYSHLILFQLICRKLDLCIDLKKNIRELIEKYTAVKNFLPSAGFPEDWENSEFWEEGLTTNPLGYHGAYI